MATASRSKSDQYHDRIKQDLLEAEKMNYYPEESPVSPATIFRKSILRMKLDKDPQMKLLLEMGCIGYEPPVSGQSKRWILGPYTGSKGKSIEGENKWDGDRIKRLKLSKELVRFLAPTEDIPREVEHKRDVDRIKKLMLEKVEKFLSPTVDIHREEMDIKEDILFDNHTAVCSYRSGPSGVEAAEAATDFIKKVKIEEYTEALRSDLLEDARDAKEINPRFSQYL
ncbi:hypothetical protein MKX01_021400 [Papaver californicum]|nr:hypothetical protein MKX01_021100 [Papaver californicum]KAI3992844.1 hypothetical protein MKX01_021400 [Papaver californicum]